MAETNEHDILSRIRTLLALERNFLAEERTALAEFRTGLAVALIAAPATSVIAYIFYIIPGEPFLIDWLSLAIFAAVAALGIWMSLRSRSIIEENMEKEEIVAGAPSLDYQKRQSR